MKTKKTFECIECGNVHSKWQGQCSECKEWNTLTEVEPESNHSAEKGKVSSGKKHSGYAGTSGSTTKKLKEIDNISYKRYSTGSSEIDRCFSGGIVMGATHLIAGEPGAGKSTLLLQLSAHISKDFPVLLSTGEESLEQVSLRAERLKIDKDLDNLNLMSETNVDKIMNEALKCGAKLLIVDSIQTAYLENFPSSPGSVTQLRESTSALNRFCKMNNICLFLVGHYTKDGSVAGPKMLEHILDATLIIEGEANGKFRMLRFQKYRFGNLETAFLAMTEKGLQSVDNPSAIFLQRMEHNTSGSIVTVLWEGTRPILVELQSLVEDSGAGHPRRLCVGFDTNRVHMMMAVIQKHIGIHISDQDVFLNVVGGLKAVDTTTDLPMILSIISSFKNVALKKEVIAFGEVGLAGEVRSIVNGVERIKEAQKLGFKYAIVPKANANQSKKINGIKIIPVSTIKEAFEAMDLVSA